MNRNTGFLGLSLLTFSLLATLFTVPAMADPGDQYCVTPPFVTAGVKPNLLLLIDNSASMYDLAYADQGKKHCSVTTTRTCTDDTGCYYCNGTSTLCTQNSDCASGVTCNKTETCSTFDRQPLYCYDETYNSGTNYAGYFDRDKVYYYSEPTGVASGEGFFYAAASTDFATVISTSPTTCPTSATNTSQTIANTMCLEYTSAKALVTFVAKGNYLNWLTSSKFDIQKKILTGGKYDGSNLIPESRGCVGQGFVKQPLSSNFVNFDDTASDPNQTAKLPIAFTIRGPVTANNVSSASRGGQTYIDLFGGAVYNNSDCQDAVEALATGTNADVKQTVGACLATAAPVSGTCQQASPPQTCTTSSQCVVNAAISQSLSVCSLKTDQVCTASTDCVKPARQACKGDPTVTCTSDTNCSTAATNGTCSKLAASYTPTLPNSAKSSVPASCTSDAACTFSKSGVTYTAKALTCQGYVAPKTFGPCESSPAVNWGSCSSNNTGPCNLPAGTVATKTKVSFQQSMQACWQVRNGHPIGNDDILTVKNQCADVYGGLFTCSNDHNISCSPTAANPCGTGNTCDSGPAAIGPGNPALLCGQSYAGQLYSKNTSGAWVLNSSIPAGSVPTGCTSGGTTAVDDCMKAIHTTFCNDMAAPNVTDPSDAPSDTATYDNLPAILSGIGVEAQLGAPIKSIRVKIATGTSPTGLVQQFSDMIRLGAMTFNQYGSASETALTGVGTPKVCSTNTSQSCYVNAECASNSCIPSVTGSTNLDGASIVYPIGLGYCSTMTSQPCTTNTDCTGTSQTCLSKYCGVKGTTRCTTALTCSGTNQACIIDGAGDHITSGSLINTLDGIRAYAWTPFSEAFYNIIGYFAAIPQTDGSNKSRAPAILSAGDAGLRLNSTDYDATQNPSESRCQQNYVLLISDGSSTADQNPTVNNLASLYASQTGITQTTCTGAAAGTTANYGGTNNLPIYTWIAKNRRISDFSLSGTASTNSSSTARESINTYVVFNGEANGASGDCNSLTLLTKAAVNGGTTLKQANNYDALVSALTSVFQDVAAKAASGTAASILSNSEGSGANILQAVFYPKKIFENATSANWIGEMQNLWYYVDPYINNSTIREDTDRNLKLNLVSDYVARFAFDPTSDKTMVQLYQDSDGNGTGDTTMGGLIDPDYVKSIWRAGKLLWARNLSSSPRTIKTTINGTSLMDFSSSTYPGGTVASNATTLYPYLNLANATDAAKLINYVHGEDQTGFRPRTVDIKDPATNTISTGVWRLGDIISSTPRVQSTVRLGTYNLPSPGGYNDNSYASFINSTDYQSHGMVYVGSNDGMLHAFNLGILSVKNDGLEKASLTGSNQGKEQWAFIPKNFLPYLKYLSDPNYQHLYAIDGRTLLLDASIGDTNSGTCVKNTYWSCDKPTNGTVVTTANALDPSKNTWRTILISGMGIGGASTKTAATDKVITPRDDPADDTKGLGYSSYFAMDVTDPVNPVLLWEFNNTELGYATTGPAIVRVGPASKNGRWFAVFGSGPTGPIDTINHQFKGRSSQPLKFFVVDLRTGALVKTIDTEIPNAFSGTLIGGAIDADRWDTTKTGNYQDDAIYVGYVAKDVKTGSATYGAWAKGGVGRITIDEVVNPIDSNVADIWHWSRVMGYHPSDAPNDTTGPVTTAIARLQDRKNLNLWLFSGTGRYYYRDSTGLDDNDTTRSLFGIKEPCYNKDNAGNVLVKDCDSAVSDPLVDQTSSIGSLSSTDKGWIINLDAATSGKVCSASGASCSVDANCGTGQTCTKYGAERVVTDTVALTNGTVFFTSFKPTMDMCGYGGDSFLWGVKYDTGGQALANTLTGKALIQLSTGEFKEIDLSAAFTDKNNRRMEAPMTGKPPSDAPPIISNSSNKPLKKILHIKEH